MFLFDIAYSFLVRRDFLHAKGELRGHCYCSSRTGWQHHRILYLENHLGVDRGPITPCTCSKSTSKAVYQTTRDDPSPSRNNRPYWRGNGTSKAFWEFRPPFCLFAAQTRWPPFFHWALPWQPNKRHRDQRFSPDQAWLFQAFLNLDK